MDIRRIRELVIIAMFADDDLMDILVLKGGNALDIAHGMNLRASIDVDFSISGDFENSEIVKHKIEQSLSERFDSEGYKLFDYKFEQKPSKSKQEIPPFWGGYEVEFKIIMFTVKNRNFCPSILINHRRSTLFSIRKSAV